jgi:signal transduction histidine kinase
VTRLYPDSITGWTIVVLVAALSVTQVATIGIISGMRSDTLEVVEHFHSAERIAGIVRIMDAVPPEQRTSLLEKVAGDTLSISWDTTPAVEQTDPESWSESLFDDVIDAALWQTPGRIHRVALDTETSSSFKDRVATLKRSIAHREGARILGAASDPERGGRVMTAAIALADGSWLNFQVPMADPSSTPGLGVILQIAASGLLIVMLSLWAVRRLTQPFTMLAGAAENLGRNVNAAPLPVSGSREMRQAAQVFNAMQERIRRFIAGRIELIAAISHDLRTPLTRLRLRAELTDSEETRNKMKADLAEMEAMIESTLLFAREEGNQEARMPVDLVSLVESVCDGLPDVTVRIDASAGSRLVHECQPLALRRCIGNLVSNAVKYGRRAAVVLAATPEAILVTVDDEGAGIELTDQERVFEAFVRLDGSRNRETGGAGLGLATARMVARNHGGDVTIRNRAEGGLRATLRLPLPG